MAMTKVKVSGDTTYRLQDWSCDNPFSYLCQSTEACGGKESLQKQALGSSVLQVSQRSFGTVDANLSFLMFDKFPLS